MESCSVRVLAADGCRCQIMAAGESCQLHRPGVGGVEEFAGQFGGNGLGCVFKSCGGEPKPMMFCESRSNIYGQITW